MMVKKFIVQAETKKEAFRKAKSKRVLTLGGRSIKLIPLSARKTPRKGLIEITARKDKRFSR